MNSRSAVFPDQIPPPSPPPPPRPPPPGRIFNTGQLDDDPVISLGDDFRFRDAELIDAVPDSLQALLHRVFLDLFNPAVPDLQGDGLSAVPRLGRSHLDIGVVILQDLFECRSRRRIGKLVGDGFMAARLLQVAEPDLVFHQGFLEVIRCALQCRLDGLLRIHLEDEVRSALKIETQGDLFRREVLFPEIRQIRNQGGRQVK